MGLLESKDDGQKPLYRKWLKTLPKNSEVPALEIETIRLSSNEDWIIIETSECVALLNLESKVGQTFWEFVNKLEGKLKCLTLIPAKGKLGFDIEPGEKVGTWDNSREDEITFSTSGRKKNTNTLGKLTLAAMQPVTPTSVNTGKEMKKENGGTGSTVTATT